MMTARELAFAGAGALAAMGGGLYAMHTPQTAPPASAAIARTNEVFLDDDGQPRVFADGTVVTCRVGGFLDGVYRFDKEWCSDGHGITWVR